MRRRGEGTVYHRRDGRWSGQVYGPDGRRRTVYGRTRADVATRLAELRERMSLEAARAAGEAPNLERLRAHASAVRRLAGRHGASNVRVFGSVARGDAGPASDYDVVVDLDPDLRGFEAFYRLDELERGLEGLLGRPVHVVTARHASDFTRRVLRDAVPI